MPKDKNPDPMLLLIVLAVVAAVAIFLAALYANVALKR